MQVHNGVFSFQGEGGVWFSLRNTTYQNNSIVNLEDIGGGDNALFCMTNLTACCHGDNNDKSALGSQSGFYRTRGQMVHGTYVLQKRWRGWNLPLWDTWCNACHPDHIHWSVLSNHWWVTVVMLQKVRFKHDRVYCMWCHMCQNLYQCKPTMVIISITFALRCYHIVYVSIHNMTTLRRENMVTW